MAEIKDKALEQVSGGSGENSLPRHSGLNAACSEFHGPDFENFVDVMQLNINMTCGMCRNAISADDGTGDIYCKLGH